MTPEGFIIEGPSGSQGNSGRFPEAPALNSKAAEKEAALLSERTGQMWKPKPIGDVPYVTDESHYVKAVNEGRL